MSRWHLLHKLMSWKEFLHTWFIELMILSSFSPEPRRSPTVLFRERLTKHVSMMSPDPDKPERVVGFAPIFVANHRISEQPWATRAAIQLFPRLIPSTIPAAIARTFFRAPAISTPVTSLKYHRSQSKYLPNVFSYHRSLKYQNYHNQNNKSLLT